MAQREELGFPLGIVGGAGVKAVNYFLYLLERQMVLVHGAYRDCHHPELILHSRTRVPSRSMFLEGSGEDFVPQYVDIINSLEIDGAKSFCMMCITAHACLNRIKERINLPIIDLLSITAKKIVSLGYKKVGILCSNGSLITKIWDNYINESQIVYPDAYFQSLVTEGICLVKKNDNTSAVSRHNDAIRYLENYIGPGGGGGRLYSVRLYGHCLVSARYIL